MIFGLETQCSLPAGWTPLEAVAVVKCLDDEGGVTIELATTAGLTAWEGLGMLEGAAYTTKRDLHDSFVAYGDEESDE